MRSKSLSAIVQAVDLSDTQNFSSLKDLKITGITCDSRKVEPGFAFFCIEGAKLNGNDFIEDAVAKGASCIFSEKPRTASTPVITVPDIRLALAQATNNYFDHPAHKLRLIGVTGTNGKTTTTHLVEHIFNANKINTGIIGTLGARWLSHGKEHHVDYGQTTPQAPELVKTLWQMLEDGMSHVSMEVSSHALALERVAGLDFASACLTNITQDHLDFHKTMEHYWKAKLLLFHMLNESKATNKSAIINIDDHLAPEFLSVIGNTVQRVTYSWHKKADIQVKQAEFNFSGCALDLSTPKGDLGLNLKLNGPFNVYNVMAAVAIALSEGVSLSQCKETLEKFSGVSGRFQIISLESDDKEKNAPLCIVDYAHTPDGLANILQSARSLVPKEGKLVVVFGCGGDRDNSKRPKMGAIAEELADRVIVTSDNPRTENPQKIIAEILAGIKQLSKVEVEADRAKAIASAIESASANDVLVVAGKGHETYQILSDRTIDFDDRLEIKQALKTRRKGK